MARIDTDEDFEMWGIWWFWILFLILNAVACEVAIWKSRLLFFGVWRTRGLIGGDEGLVFFESDDRR
jgi:hypothetical protein